jgi:ABC-type xylose transport system permease subunit
MADIGSLVVKLAAETSEFQADLGRSARVLDKHASEMKASLQQVASVAKTAFAVVIGGASLSGGRGTVLGTMVGALIMTVVNNGCTKLEMSNWVQEIVTGGIIVAAVTLDQYRRGRSA